MNADQILKWEPAQIKTDNFLQLSPIKICEEYRKKWNIHCLDFVFLTRNGQILNNNTLYRVGGLGDKNIQGKDYFMLIKHIEAYYPDSITTDPAGKLHLATHWCIIDKNGVEKVVFKPFASPYLVRDSQIYSIDRHYYNIETGEFYCESDNLFDTSAFIFLNNQYDKDKSRRGVMKIDKKTGKWELFR